MAISLDEIRSTAEAMWRAMERFRYDSPNDLREAVAEYGRVVVEVNARLRQAHVLLRKGEREAALHACEADPNVLECVSELDTADQSLEAWFPTFEEIAVERPERLLSDVAGELGDAYDNSHQIASLLRTHRLLAIGRGALEDRVATLRRIVHLDSDTNPFWAKDLKDYETKCKVDLEAEINAIGRLPAEEITAAAFARARQILKQLSAADWQEPLGAEAIKAAEMVVDRLRGERALVEMAELAPLLQAALGAADLEEAKKLCIQWEKCTKRVRNSEQHPLAEVVRPVLAWVDEEIAREAAEQELNAATQDLDSACFEAIPFRPGEARALRRRIQDALHRVSVAESSAPATEASVAAAHAALLKLKVIDRVPLKFWGAIGSAAAASVLVVGLLAMWGMRAAHRQAVIKQYTETVVPGLDAQKVQAAKAAWNDFLADFPDAPTLVYPPSEPKTIQEDYDERFAGIVKIVEENLGKLRQWLGEAERLLAEALPLIANVKDSPEVNGAEVGRRVREAEEPLDRVEDVLLPKMQTSFADYETKVGSNQSEVRELRTRLNTVRSGLDERRGDLNEAVVAVKDKWKNSLNARLKSLKSLPDEGLAGKRNDLEDLRKEITEFAAFAGETNSPLLDDCETLEDRVVRHDARERVKRSLAEAAASGLPAFMACVGREAEDCKDDGIKADLSKVLQDQAAVEAALAWAKVAESYKSGAAGGPSAKVLIAAINAAREKEEKPEGFEEADEKLTQLVSILEQWQEEGTGTLKELRDSLDTKIMQNDVLVLEDVKEGKKIYVYTDVVASKEGAYFYGVDKINPKSRTYPKLKDAPGAARPAPHAQLAKGLRAAIDAIKTGRDVDDFLFSAMDKIINEPEGSRSNPILCCLLLKDLSERAAGREIAATDESGLSKALETLDEELGDIKASQNWPEFNDKTYSASLETAEAALKKIRTQKLFDAVRDAYEARKKALADPPAFAKRLKYYGWVDYTDNVPAIRVASKSDKTTGSLYAVQSNEDSEWSLKPAGQSKSTGVTAGIGTSGLFGLPIFVVPEAGK